MNPRKENSTNHINELYWKDRCGIAFTLATIGGRWKINILSYLLNEGNLRYSELIAKLKELEHDKLINRIVYQQVPPKVEYELTELGRSLEEILNLMDRWGEDNLPESML